MKELLEITLIRTNLSSMEVDEENVRELKME